MMLVKSSQLQNLPPADRSLEKCPTSMQPYNLQSMICVCKFTVVIDRVLKYIPQQVQVYHIVLSNLSLVEESDSSLSHVVQSLPGTGMLCFHY